MIILAQHYEGCIHRCECGALLGYGPNDINEGQFIYCPVCHIRQKTTMNLNYDGLIIEEKKNDTVV